MPEEEVIEEEVQISEDGYITASKTMYTTPEDVPHMIATALKVHKETRPHCLLDDRLEMKVLCVFKEAIENALTCTYTKFYPTVEQAATLATYLGEADDVNNTKLECWSSPRNFYKISSSKLPSDVRSQQLSPAWRNNKQRSQSPGRQRSVTTTLNKSRIMIRTHRRHHLLVAQELI